MEPGFVIPKLVGMLGVVISEFVESCLAIPMFFGIYCVQFLSFVRIPCV